MQTWFISSTTYGTWLPGDERGSVSNMLDEDDLWIRHNRPNTPYDAADFDRQHLARAAMNGKPVFLQLQQAEAIAAQFHETMHYRNWKPHALAIMTNHFHVVLSASDSVSSQEILRDLKSYASRRLNKHWPRPASGTWWTESGSRRPVNDEDHFTNAVRYVADHPAKLAVWIDPLSQPLLSDRPQRNHES